VHSGDVLLSDQLPPERVPRLRPLRVAAFLLGAVLAVLAGGDPASAAAEIRSYAIVQDDGTLRVQGRTIRLYGVYMPDTAYGCRSDFSPPLCGDRAVRALKTLIRGFVRCLPQARLADRSISAVCYVDASSISQPPIDLGAQLINEGLALAAPGAPFEYQALERIAEANGRGVWGFQVDRVIR
jgi:endonuclease YncB( thermonuclease family)